MKHKFHWTTLGKKFIRPEAFKNYTNPNFEQSFKDLANMPTIKIIPDGKSESVQNVSYFHEPIMKHNLISPKDDQQTKEFKLEYPTIVENGNTFIVYTNNRYYYFCTYGNFYGNNANVPRFLTWLCHPDDRRIILAAYVHDYLIKYHKVILKHIQLVQHHTDYTQKQFVKDTAGIFRILCYQQGYNKFQSSILYWCVYLFQLVKFLVLGEKYGENNYTNSSST